MATIVVLGKLGKDAEVKDVSGTALAKFSVAENVGYGDKKQTIWYDVNLWGKQASSGFVDYLKKGQQVQVTGELSTREYNGKTYLEIRVWDIKLCGGKPENSQQQPAPQQQQGYGQQPQKTAPVDLEDSLPF